MLTSSGRYSPVEPSVAYSSKLPRSSPTKRKADRSSSLPVAAGLRETSLQTAPTGSRRLPGGRGEFCLLKSFAVSTTPGTMSRLNRLRAAMPCSSSSGAGLFAGQRWILHACILFARLPGTEHSRIPPVDAEIHCAGSGRRCLAWRIQHFRTLPRSSATVARCCGLSDRYWPIPRPPIRQGIGVSLPRGYREIAGIVDARAHTETSGKVVHYQGVDIVPISISRKIVASNAMRSTASALRSRSCCRSQRKSAALSTPGRLPGACRRESSTARLNAACRPRGTIRRWRDAVMPSGSPELQRIMSSEASRR